MDIFKYYCFRKFDLLLFLNIYPHFLKNRSGLTFHPKTKTKRVQVVLEDFFIITFIKVNKKVLCNSQLCVALQEKTIGRIFTEIQLKNAVE